MTMPSPCRHLSAVILAGGRGRRLGGLDKGLVDLCGRPLAAWLIEALRPQVDDILVNANRNRARYQALGVPVVDDRLPGHQGPLAGLAAALEAAAGDCLLSVPADAPLLAPDYAQRMREAMREHRTPACVATCAGRVQPVHCLLQVTLAPALRDWLAAGGRSPRAWLDDIGAARVDFSDRPQQFMDLDRPDDRARLERALCH